MATLPTVITDLSATAASNYPAGSDAPSVLDDVQRAHGGFIRDLLNATQSNAYTAFTTGGTSTAYTLTPSPAITAYAAGQSFFVTFNAACGNSPTINISGLGALALVKMAPDGTYATILSGDIPSSHMSRVTVRSGAANVLVEDMPASVSNGGTGATDAATARTNLGAAPSADPTFTGTVTAPKVVSTITTIGTIPSGSATTIYTIANAAPSAWLVSANNGTTNDVANYGAFAVILADGTSARIALASNGANLTITLSGLAIQSTQTSGLTSAITVTVTRIA